MSEETLNAPTEWFGGILPRFLNIRLAGAAAGLLLALLIAPSTRRLFLAQAGLTLPVSGTVVSVAVGNQSGTLPNAAFCRDGARAAHGVAESHPNDLQLQLADASAFLPEDSGSSSGFSIPSSVQKVQRLRALESRFGNQASLYANILRYESMGEVQVHHDSEQAMVSGEPLPSHLNKKRPEDGAIYRAYDRDAAEGERLDPDNAYFPFMRAIGLFAAQRDTEALAAMTRAAQKTLWREYYNDELQGQWRLQDETFVNNSALFHSLSAASILFPQYGRMRAAVRVTIYAAMRAEQTGQTAEGLSLRKSVVRLGSLMRVQSANLIGCLVGNALTEIALARPAGLPAITFKGSNEKAGKAQQRLQFDTYLQRIGAARETGYFHAAQQAGDDVRDIVRHGMGTGPFDQPLGKLFLWWVVDLVTLSNILWLLVLGGLSTLLLRNRRLKEGQALPGTVRVAVSLGLISGGLIAPTLFTGASPYFLNIASGDRNSMLLCGLVALLLLPALFALTGQERKRRLCAFGGALVLGTALTGFYFWQARGLAGIVQLTQVYSILNSEGGASEPDLRNWLLWLTPCVSFFSVIILTTLSRTCRVPLSVGLARGFRGLMVPLAALLFLAYGGMLLFTARAESAVQYGLERTLENEGQYVADLSGKLWPRSDVAKKMVDP